jgi:wyosine [tRNA(Phe)-imidazoG37] synthetase (radical SAM superfamily)
MATFLFEKIVFGPIKSRRLGSSLGINLLPVDSKLCNFDCIYCECGWNDASAKKAFHPREEVKEALKAKLEELKKFHNLPDVITFAGNGEPTMHPDFEGIIDDTIALRNEHSPKTKIAVLSNATLIGREKVFNALKKVDQNILKLDSAFEETVLLVNKPHGEYSTAKVVERLKEFKGQVTIQTMFLRGTFDGKPVDNTTHQEIEAWLNLLAEIKPKEVMVYTIDRDTPAPDLVKVPAEELHAIAHTVTSRLGIHTQVSA